MFHHPHHFGWADHVRRTQTEREHQKMPIEPLYGPRTTPLWQYLICGLGLGLLLVWGLVSQ